MIGVADAAGVAAPTGVAAEASRRVMRIAATVWSAVWLPAVVVALVVEWDTGSALPWVGMGLLAVAAVAWFSCLILRLLPVETFAVTVLGTGLVQVANTIPPAPGGVPGAMVPWVNVGVMCAALLLRPKLAAAAVVTTASAEWLLLFLHWLATVDPVAAIFTSSSSPVYSFAIGMAAVSCAAGSDRLARMDDQAAVELDGAIEEARAEEARCRSKAQVARVLHDTVVNTLGFIGRGGAGVIPADQERVRARCRFDMAALGDLSAPRRPIMEGDEESVLLGWLRDMARERSGALGIRLHDSVSGSDPDAGGDLVVAASSVLDEALLNTAKHAGTGEAWLEVTGRPDALTLAFWDAGRGCGRTTTEGLILSLRERLTGTSADVEVTSAVDGGTRIEIGWSANPADSPPQEPGPGEGMDVDRLARGVFSLVARRASIWLTVMLLWFIGIGGGQRPWVSAWGAFALMTLGLGMALALGRGGRHLPWPISALMVLLAGAIVYLPMVEATGCARVGGWWWGPDGGLLIVIVLVLLVDNWRWWLAGCTVYLLAAAAVLVPTAPTAPQCAGLAAAALMGNVAVAAGVIAFRRMLARTGRQAVHRRALARIARSRIVAARVSSQVRQEGSDAALRSVGPLLSGLADGSLNPADPAIRRRCLAEESALRATLMAGVSGSGLGRVAMGWARLAVDLGVRLEVRPIESDLDPGTAELRWVSSAVASALGRMEPGRQATLTVLPDAGTVVLALLCPRMADPDRSWLADPPAGLSVSAIETGDELLVEMIWSRSS